MLGGKKQIDDLQSATLALATRLVAPAQLPESTRAGHDLACIGTVAQKELQCEQSGVIEVLANVTGEGGRLEELHMMTIRALRMFCDGAPLGNTYLWLDRRAVL